MKDKFEWLCRQNSVVAEYLDKCEFVDGQYELIRPDPDNQWMADRLTGAYWAFCEQEKAVNVLKADLEHYKRGGYAVVPASPTSHMLETGVDNLSDGSKRNPATWMDMCRSYKAMIAPYVK